MAGNGGLTDTLRLLPPRSSNSPAADAAPLALRLESIVSGGIGVA